MGPLSTWKLRCYCFFLPRPPSGQQLCTWGPGGRCFLNLSSASLTDLSSLGVRKSGPFSFSLVCFIYNDFAKQCEYLPYAVHVAEYFGSPKKPGC